MEGTFRDLLTLVLCLIGLVTILVLLLKLISRRHDHLIIDDDWVDPHQIEFSSEELDGNDQFIEAFNGFYRGK